MIDENEAHQRIEAAILARCAACKIDSSICPSEVARALWPDDWREHMNDVRTAGLALAREGKIVITQRGERRDPNAEIRGAIRYRINL